MKIEVLNPVGYCNGVLRAISLVKSARESYKDKNIFIFGMLINNTEIIKYLDSINVITLNGNKEEIEDIVDGSVVIFTAHGHDKKLEEILNKKGCVIIDAICKNVESNLNLAYKYQKEGYKIAYIGNSNHPETKAFINNINDVYLIDKERLKNYYFSTNDNIVVLNQTSLDYDYVNDIHCHFKNSENVKCINTVCAVSQTRQNTIKHLDETVDLIIVVGDKISSNTTKLFNLAKSLYPNKELIFINSYKELDTSILKNKNHIVISSGASASKESVDMIVKFIKDNVN